MKPETRSALKIVIFALLCGVLACVVNAIIDRFVFYKQMGQKTFLDLLVLDLSPHEAYMRLVMLLCFLVFGLLVAGEFARRRKAEADLRDSESCSRALVEASFEGIAITLDGKILEANQAFAAMLGYELSEVIGLTPNDLATPESAARIMEHIRAGDENPYEIDLVKKDGAILESELVGKNAVYKGQKVRVTGFRDITERKRVQAGLQAAHDELERRVDERTTDLKAANEKLRAEIAERERAEEAWRESEEKWRSLVENAPDIITTLARDGTILFINHVPSGKDVAQTTGTSVYDYISPEGQEALRETLKRVFATGQTGQYETAGAAPGGVTRWYRSRIGPIKNEGQVVAAVIISTDITEQRQADRAHGQRVKELSCLYGIARLRSEPELTLEEMLQGIVEIMPGGWQYPECCCARLRLDQGEYVSANFRESPWRLRADIIVNAESVGAIEIFYSEEKPRESEGLFLQEERKLLDDIAARTGLLIEHRKADESLRLFRNMIDRSNDAFYVVDAETGLFVEVNEQACANLGYTREEYLRLRVVDIEIKDREVGAWQKHVRHVRDEGPLIIEGRHQRKDGSTLDVEINTKYTEHKGHGYIVAVVRDISERKHLEAQLIRTERLAAVGTLAGGIAHEFNNINVTVLGYSELALGESGLNPELRDWLQRILRASRRARNITENLLAFARARRQPTAMGNLVQIISDTMDLMTQQFEQANICLDLKLRDVPETLMDTSEIGQVVLNLLLNAVHAMRGRRQKTLAIETGSAGERIFARFTDTGCGIPKDNLRKVFTPFFSTKGEFAGDSPQAAIHGTGLGLSVSHTIMGNHDGEIVVESEENVGSTFTLWLPVREAEGSAASPPETDQDRPARRSRGKAANILVLDDEEDTRQLLALVLGRKGYKVTLTGDLEEALRIVRAGAVDLVLADILLRGENSLGFLAELQNIREPERPVTIVITGCALPEARERCGHLGVSQILQKPFDLDEVLRAVRGVLGK